MSNQNIILGDCLTKLPEIDKESVDVVVTSFPYNLKIKYNTYKDDKPRKEYLKWVEKVLVEIKRTMKLNGSFFLNIGASSSDPWLPYDMSGILRNHFILQNTIMWVKNISIGEKSFGHFKPINSKRYLNHNFEYIFHLTNTGEVEIDRLSVGVPYTFKVNVNRWKSVKKDKRCAGDVWYIPYDTINSKKEKGKHPAIFPVALAKKCIELHGVEDDMVVLDPMVGVGSTMVAAKQLNVNGIGIDIDEKYVDFAQKRLK